MASQPQEHEKESVIASLESLVGYDITSSDSASLSAHPVENNAITPGHKAASSWWRRFFPSDDTIDRLFADENMGNYVVIRSTGQEIFEAMPLYVRVGMHLLFYHSRQSSLLRWSSVSHALISLSQHQGKLYDDSSDPAAVRAHIESFVQTYSIPLDELAQPDLAKYPTFNSFFTRALKDGARPIAPPLDDPAIILSAADCRLTVFPTVDEATRFWIKGQKFSLSALLDDESVTAQSLSAGASLAIFRLAPADYHRFHSPVGPCTSGPTKHVKGELFTVNPQAVNQDFNVFTANRRDILHSTWHVTPTSKIPYAFVAIGAMLVGSIGWSTPASTQGSTSVRRGDELGYFAYGGSTVVVVFPAGSVQWDEDLRKNSQRGVETMVRVGERIGNATGR
ncbi:hypothetical protein BDZ90DRAFT_224228 [Jaminaea rosea]|uniref:phosphatidylserine decarboxylase n=1 Tax=Jaminaea rosea TaxID=1569628 RepID=A0A316UNU4_9BASI|nr:hypothetical protein BDZ90DRAFT_224228 [Jaminaea rosea]PWN24835.1 hypothetical protein BDZ90DRAFT_224228 [Jaminaea rosea]